MTSLRRRLRGLALSVVLLSMVVYVGSYYWLSRRGMREAPAYGLDGFLYMPVAEAAASHDITRHHLLALFYAPANQIDRLLFDGEPPVGGILWELSG